jgi:hypothetical protein
VSHHRVPTTAALALLALAVPSVAQAQAPVPSPQRTLTVVATGHVPVERPERQTNATIAAAVRRAQDQVAPAAIAAARGEAIRLGYAANLHVRGLLSVADVAPSPFGPFGYSQLEGTFGPGRFCGTTRTPIRRTVDGVSRSTGRFRTRRSCRIPREATRTISATYEVVPK